jgi:ABC-type bacteriocin/lantibiotic exporter with double-glycine peptidase domain
MDYPYYMQETEYSCGAASMRMVLAYFGIDKSEAQVRKLLGTRPDGGTYFAGFLNAAKKLKLKYVSEENSSITHLEPLLKGGYQIIVCYYDVKDKTDHYAVVKKIDAEKIHFFDPWYGAYHNYSKAYFRKIWHSRERKDKAKRWFIAIKK